MLPTVVPAWMEKLRVCDGLWELVGCWPKFWFADDPVKLTCAQAGSSKPLRRSNTRTTREQKDNFKFGTNPANVLIGTFLSGTAASTRKPGVVAEVKNRGCTALLDQHQSIASIGTGGSVESVDSHRSTVVEEC
jgi:hypothetical protein